MHLLKLSVTVALALAAGHVGAATVTLDPHGLGQGLLFPYFTTHNGQSTLLTVQNTTAQGKALKVRVLESKDGQPTLVFNLYLPPFGQWSSALSQTTPGDDVAATLLPGGTSVGCAVPALPAEGLELQTYAYDGDGGPQGPARTREGYVEVVEMGTLNKDLTQLTRDPTTANCDVFTQRTLKGGAWATDENAGIEPLSGGLRGDVNVIDVEGGTAFSYGAPAFSGLATSARHTTLWDGAINSQPSLASIEVAENEPVAVTVVDRKGVPVTLEYTEARGAYAISALLATATTTNRFDVSPELRARTEWVVSFPTRHYLHRAFAYGTPPPNTLLAAPFTRAECEPAALVAWDQQGRKLETDAAVDVCGAVQVLQFAEGSAAANAQMANADDPVLRMPVSAGTARLDFSQIDGRKRTFFPDENGKCLVGLPAWVMAVQSYDNDNAQEGRIATFPVSNVSSGPVDVVDCDTLD